MVACGPVLDAAVKAALRPASRSSPRTVVLPPPLLLVSVRLKIDTASLVVAARRQTFLTLPVLGALADMPS